MEIRRFVVSPIQANCYVLSESLDKGARAVIVDPGDTDLTQVFTYIDDHEFKVEANWNTHAHFDHVLGVDIVRDKYHCPSYLHPDDQGVWDATPASTQQWIQRNVEPLNAPDEYYRDGDTVNLAGEVFTIWHTPGHSPGGVCLVGREFALTGDTLFRGTVGRTDLPKASPGAMDASLKRILEWDDNLVIYPGHGESTTFGVEREHNRFLRIAARGGE
ncbi:MBL fold metallo-hydrolase [Alicyclobacillus dauci]|uniref:MBL fold metallo-hydrolase n=1 Tax=Alicyclobacillus dauci TaxID=1475485 RepID=A0ABY6Z6R7_9BACL|nr:MBL fold metallo-hydrolase [Alicyclobacillus dauci]WAH38440.1 MBL fold metallo-hydrolase [Alicyclobacillus dauci]